MKLHDSAEAMSRLPVDRGTDLEIGPAPDDPRLVAVAPGACTALASDAERLQTPRNSELSTADGL